MFKRAVSVCLTLLASTGVFAADDAKYQEGVHYTVLDNPLPTTTRGEEIGEIMEFFSYSCIHCFNVEPAIERFLEEKPDNIRFTQVPVMFNPRNEPEVRAYYVGQILKIGEQANKVIFDTIHKERKALRSDAQFANLFAEELGVSEEKYMATAYSFGVDPLVQKSIRLTGDSGVRGTPTIVANGKYVIDSGAVGGNEMALYAAKYLIEQDAE